jgi:Family of unknown function (DUF6282)
MKHHTERSRAVERLGFAAGVAVLCAAFALTLGASRGQEAGQGAGAQGRDEWRVDPMRGPVDLGLTDPALIGAIDVHVHLDPDAPGAGGQIRALDAFDAVTIAKARGMRGFVLKMHQDVSAAGVAYLVRRHLAPGFEIFGRMASNYATGGVNVAALEHYSQIKGGWGRIFEPKSLSWRSTSGGQIAVIMRYGEETRGFAGAPDG